MEGTWPDYVRPCIVSACTRRADPLLEMAGVEIVVRGGLREGIMLRVPYYLHDSLRPCQLCAYSRGKAPRRHKHSVFLYQEQCATPQGYGSPFLGARCRASGYMDWSKNKIIINVRYEFCMHSEMVMGHNYESPGIGLRAMQTSMVEGETGPPTNLPTTSGWTRRAMPGKEVPCLHGARPGAGVTRPACSCTFAPHFNF